MSLDLTLVLDSPLGRTDRSSKILGYTRLPLPRIWSVHDRLSNLADALPLECPMMWYGDEGLHDRTTDPFGDPLTVTTAGRLARYETTSTEHPVVRGVIALLRCLHPDVRVVLWWH